jgi:hypothetical protein
MKRALDPLRSVSHCFETLSGGRAPGSWRRDVLRQTRRLGAIRQACGWVEELVNVDLRLSDQPRFGYSLAALVTRGSPNALPAESRPSRTQFNQEHDALRRAATRNSSSSPATEIQEPKRSPWTSEEARSPGSTQAISQLQHQADPSLLSRLAGEKTNSIAKAEREQLKPIEERQRQNHVRTPAFLREDVLPSALIERVAWRAEKAWWRDSSETSDSHQAAADPNEVISSGSPLLADYWSMPVDGVRVSADLLTQLANSETLIHRGIRREVARETTRPTTADSQPSPAPHKSAQLPDPQISGSFAEPADTAYRPPQRSTPLTAPTTDPWPSQVNNAAGSTPSSAFSESWPPAVGSEKERQAPARIAPPTVTPSLVPLRPPPAPGIAALPVAAATAQRGARNDEAVARGEDLTLMAAQIERILNEEARRHGIDV